MYNLYQRNPPVGSQIRYENAKGVMIYQRKKNNRSVPHTFSEANEILLADEEFQSIYKGYVKADDGSEALLFTSDDLIKVLKTAEEIFHDGTFEVHIFIGYGIL